MQYVGSPQTSFRFGTSMTRSVSVSSLVSIGEAASDGGESGGGMMTHGGSVSSRQGQPWGNNTGNFANSVGGGGAGGGAGGVGGSLPRNASWTQRQSPTTATVGFNIPDRGGGEGGGGGAGGAGGGGGGGTSHDTTPTSSHGGSLVGSFQSRSRFSPQVVVDNNSQHGGSSFRDALMTPQQPGQGLEPSPPTSTSTSPTNLGLGLDIGRAVCTS